MSFILRWFGWWRNHWQKNTFSRIVIVVKLLTVHWNIFSWDHYCKESEIVCNVSTFCYTTGHISLNFFSDTIQSYVIQCFVKHNYKFNFCYLFSFSSCVVWYISRVYYNWISFYKWNFSHHALFSIFFYKYSN